MNQLPNPLIRSRTWRQRLGCGSAATLHPVVDSVSKNDSKEYPSLNQLGGELKVLKPAYQIGSCHTDAPLQRAYVGPLVPVSLAGCFLSCGVAGVFCDKGPRQNFWNSASAHHLLGGWAVCLQLYSQRDDTRRSDLCRETGTGVRCDKAISLALCARGGNFGNGEDELFETKA